MYGCSFVPKNVAYSMQDQRKALAGAVSEKKALLCALQTKLNDFTRADPALLDGKCNITSSLMAASTHCLAVALTLDARTAANRWIGM